jgi:hypothetical protein
MIAGDENDTRSLAGFPEKLLQHVVVRLQPERTALQAPEIDDIAHEIDGVRVIVADKVEERFRLASARAEMNIGDEKSPVLARLARPAPIVIAVLRHRFDSSMPSTYDRGSCS